MLENVPLSEHSTMQLGGPAKYLTEIKHRNELLEVLAWANEKRLAVVMIGDGSNIFWNDNGFDGLVIVNRIMHFEVVKQSGTSAYFTIGAGENWDSVVERTVELGYSGIEQLSLIPGTTGATPIQNVGAYGREVSDVLFTIQAYDQQDKKFVTLRPSECNFGYRTSRFKTSDKGRFFITSVTFRLTKTIPKPPFYQALQSYLDEHKIAEYTPDAIRQAVIAIRRAKLPDPALVANNGSFFANPVIDRKKLGQLLLKHPGVKHWAVDNGKAKISAAWLIEQSGFKGEHDSETGMSVWPGQALVLVNEHAQKTADLLKFKRKIVTAVKEKFGLTLEQEPELIS